MKKMSMILTTGTTTESTTSRFDEYLDRIEGLRQEVLEAIDREVRSARGERNDFVSLHRLPIELFVHILQLSLPLPEEGPDYVFHLDKLRLTCRRWRDAIEGTPSLSAVVAVGHGWSRVNTALEKMRGTYPLHIYCGSTTNSKCSQVLLQLGNYIDRCQTLDVEMREWDETRVHLLSSPAPRLRRLRIEGFRALDASTNQNFNLFSGYAERLEDIRAWGCELPWESPVFRGLISLELCFCRGLKISHLVGILVASPDLTSLDLTKNNYVTDIHPDPDAALEMIRLKALTINDISADRLTPVFDAFRAPNCQRFHLQVELGEHENATTFLLSTLSPYRSFLQTTLANHSKGFIEIPREHILKFGCTTGFGEESAVPLDLYFEGLTIDNSIQFLQRMLEGSHPSGPRVKLLIGGDWGDAGVQALSVVVGNCTVVDLWIGAVHGPLPFNAYGVLRRMTELEALRTLETVTIFGHDWNGGRIIDAMVTLSKCRNGRSHVPLRLTLLGTGKNTGEHFEESLRELDMFETVRWLHSDATSIWSNYA